VTNDPVSERPNIAVERQTIAVERQNIAVVGAGVAGICAAYLLGEKHDVTLFEEADVLGGHAHTVTLKKGPDAGTPFDVAFMILNDRNYPTFHRLLERLGGVTLLPSEMSFGFESLDASVSYALNWRPGYAERTLGADWPIKPPGPALLGAIVRFFRLASRDRLNDELGTVSYGDYLARRGFDAAFVADYALPTAAALWSIAPNDVASTPASFILDFYAHHGLLSLDEGPAWQTIAGGSQSYVERFARAFSGEIVTGAGVFGIERDGAGVTLHTRAGPRRFERVVIATHADTALALLRDASPDETRLLAPWRYQKSQAVLHTDPALMPTQRGAWASWNYVQTSPHATATGPTLTYHLDRLQARTGLAQSYFLSLNPAQAIAPAHIHGEFVFTHPIYSAGALATRNELAALTSHRTHFCGSYMGAGFHEDAARAGAAVAASLGCLL
jgi:predicted NAD/FAD-binding protein